MSIKHPTPKQSAVNTQTALIRDCKICLASGMSKEEWIQRIQILIGYSLPPDTERKES